MQRDLISVKVRLIYTYTYLYKPINDIFMPGSKFKIEKQCEVCGKSFLAKTVYSKYCCRNCSDAAYRQNQRDKKKEQQRAELISQIPADRPYITVGEAVALFRISRDTIYRLIRNGKIPSINMGERLTRICRTSLEVMFGSAKPVPSKLIQTKTSTPKSVSFEKENCYTIGEISKKFGVSDSTVRKTIRKMSIPTRQIGKCVYAPKSEINKVFNAK